MVAIAKRGALYVEHVQCAFGTIDNLAKGFKRQGIRGFTIERLNLKDAYARIEKPLETTDAMTPPIEMDSWSAIRLLLEWQMRNMPAGGQGYTHEEWILEQIYTLTDNFADSSHAAHLPKPERELAVLFIRIALTYRSGTPSQWNPFLIEWLLLEYVPG